MARIRSEFFRRGGRWLKQLQAAAHHRTLLLFLATLLCTGVLLPTRAYTAAENSVIQRLRNPQELAQQGSTLYSAEQFNDAAVVFQQAAAAFEAQGDGLRQAMALSNLSLALQQLGSYSSAEKAIAASLELLHERNLGNSNEQAQILAQALDVQGRLQLAQGQAETALTTWRQAAAFYAQLGDALGITRSRINTAQTMQALGLYRQAQKTLTESTQLLDKQPDSPLKATGLRSLGNVLQVVGDLEQSRRVLQQSLAVATRVQSNQAISDAWLSLGNAARAQQDQQAAIKFYQQAATASGSPTIRVQAQLNQLLLLLETGQLKAALTLSPQIQSQIAELPPSRTAVYARIKLTQGLTRLKQNNATTQEWSEIAKFLATAIQQAKSLGDQRAEAYALGNLAGLYEQTQQWSSAQDLTKQALLKAQAINAPEITYRWLWQLGRLFKAQGNTQAAIAAYTEAVNTLNSLRSDLVAINPDIQFDFRESVEPVYRQLVGLLLQSQGSGPSQQNLAQARTVIESLQLAELNNFFRVACLTAQPVLVDQVIDKDNPTAAVIYPIILADRLEVILKLPQQPNLRHYVTNVPQSKVESTLEQLRQTLVTRTSQEFLPFSQQVYDWLLGPAESELHKSGVKTLVFVLDGFLRNIPMAALYNGEQYLVEKYSVALSPGLSLLNPKPLAQVSLQALVAGLTEARLGFSALTNVAVELNQIKSEVPSTVLLNQQFTSTALQNQINSLPFPVVHLATHGQFSSNPDQTFILAWDKPIKVNELSQLLQLVDTSRPNALELLVLSACETAAGDERAALGLAGVAVRSGARSTLASLWSLNDESSALLLSEFYRELAKIPVTKAEALRRAQIALLKNRTYRHPIYWAPFVLVGNWL